MSDWSKINEFCKVKALPASQNTADELPARVKFITEWLDSMNMAYEVDQFTEEVETYSGGGFFSWFDKLLDDDESNDPDHDDVNDEDWDDGAWEDWEETMLDDNTEEDNKPFSKDPDEKNEKKITENVERKRTPLQTRYANFQQPKREKPEPKIVTKYYYNIMLKGTSDKMLCAHHDIVNPRSDNANDNSASVINAIMAKKLRPDINVVIVDGEEIGGKGSKHAAQQVKDGEWGTIKWVLNLELTGSGGETFFISTTQKTSALADSIKEIFKCPTVSAPFNDSYSFIAQGIDSVNINPLPTTETKTSTMHKGKYLQMDMLWNCHSMRDSLSTISPDDMKIFTEKVICPIVDDC